MKYYVYIYLDPRKPGQYKYDDILLEYEPFYVGKGSGNRYLVHLNRSINNSSWENNSRKYSKIKSILNDGLEPFIIIYKWLDSEDESLLLEKILVEKIGKIIDKKGPLTNVLDGGVKSPSLSGELNGMYSRSIYDTWVERYGKEIADTKMSEYRSKMSLSISGRSHSSETKKTMSKSTYVTWQDDEVRSKRIDGVRNWWVNMSDEMRENISNKISISNSKRVIKDETRIKMSRNNSGDNNPRACKIYIDGDVYNSIKSACENLNISRTTVINRLSDSRWTEWYRLE